MAIGKDLVGADGGNKVSQSSLYNAQGVADNSLVQRDRLIKSLESMNSNKRWLIRSNKMLKIGSSLIKCGRRAGVCLYC